ncbi:GTP-binding protein [Shimia sp. R11_0]|uniref:CobW family GTP-binding protein n=1 Tax=Shimia sp. R11_0 TaxID=2821096 RepID=UPI001ADA0E3F|nr:GTP-binding protein [Shimia sp. R11_0]MBO9477639.1 GTP-binding protein [Shimia sp. R11_0]
MSRSVPSSCAASVSATVPVTVLNGFLGAGKTTLLQSLLVQARQLPHVRLGVIVNEMSTLDVDGAILDGSEVLSRQDARFVSIAAGSISGPEGLAQFGAAVDRLLAADVTHVLIETSGSTHPWPLLEALRAHDDLRLHGFLSVVDCLTLAQDHDFGHTIVPGASRNLAAGQRGIENLLAEQIMFCNRILLSKMDRVDQSALHRIAQAVHPINRGADVMGMQWGNLRLESILQMGPYDHDRVAQLGAELTAWDVEHDTSSMASAADYRIESVVIADARPFHPQRLWDVYNHYLGTGIYRSKGFFWLPSRDQYQLLWNQTAGSVGLEVVNFWKIATLEDDSLNLLPQERAEMRRRLQGQSQAFGDRRCRLTVIGDRDGLADFATAVRACFCTEAEIAAWKAGIAFEDPWPKTLVTLS